MKVLELVRIKLIVVINFVLTVFIVKVDRIYINF